jgi:NTP pyrophosphatase (non-canonical NTP hydrolase)
MKLVSSNDSITEMQTQVVQWADAAFPHRQPWMAFLKLYEEIGEVVRKPHAAGEWADVFIMLVDLAHMHGIRDIGRAVEEKMAINRARKWHHTATGTMQHNGEEDTHGNDAV